MDDNMKAFHVDHKRVVDTTYQGRVTANRGDWIVTDKSMNVVVLSDREFRAKFSLGKETKEKP